MGGLGAGGGEAEQGHAFAWVVWESGTFLGFESGGALIAG